MIEKSKKVTLMWRLHNDPFQQANKEQFIDKVYPRRIGSNITAVNTLLANGEELEVLMPRILGVDPKSTSSNWDKLVSNYWNSLSVEVYSNGLDLEIGFKYEFDTRHKVREKEIAKLKDIKSDEDLIEFVEGRKKDGTPNVSDQDKYKYATPIKEEDWLLYRYCVGINGKGYKRVSNSMTTTEMSPDIDFYIYDENIAKEARRVAHEVNRKALSKYMEVIAKRDLVDQLLLVFKVTDKFEDDLDKDMALDTLARTRPQEFVNYANDKNLMIKAQIESYINTGILRRLPGTSIIVDNDQPDVIVGNNLSEAVTFFSPDNTKSKVAVSEYSIKYKAKTTKK